MKKGCFIKVIGALTIIIAVIAYLIQNDYHKIIFEPLKSLGKSEVKKEIEEDLKNVRNSPEKDSLINIASFYFGGQFDSLGNGDDIVIGGDISDKFYEKFIKKAKRDSIITKDEILELKDIITREEKNERQ